MKIVIPDDHQKAVRSLACFERLAGHEVEIYYDSLKQPAELAERFQAAEALVLIRERTLITEDLLSRLPNLKLISQTGQGIAHIDLAACNRHRVAVATSSGSPYATAELTWVLVVAALRKIPQEVARLKTGQWQPTLGIGLRGRTLGIQGFGKIGSLVAGYGRAFGMQVLVSGRAGSRERAQAAGFVTVDSDQELFAQADVLCIHLKLTPETRHSITAASLDLMKPEALLVNTSRAELIEPGALAAALTRGRPGLAAVDVYEEEPLSADDPLLHLENAICTPHLGYVEKDSYELFFGGAFDHVIAFAAGQPRSLVNPQVLE